MSEKIWHVMPKTLLGGGNSILRPTEDDGSFAISYQPNRDNPLGNADDDLGETAICDYRRDDGNRYYILRGDFRKEYERLVDEGIHACIAFFESKPELRSSWSSDAPFEQWIEARTSND